MLTCVSFNGHLLLILQTCVSRAFRGPNYFSSEKYWQMQVCLVLNLDEPKLRAWFLWLARTFCHKNVPNQWMQWEINLLTVQGDGLGRWGGDDGWVAPRGTLYTHQKFWPCWTLSVAILCVFDLPCTDRTSTESNPRHAKPFKITPFCKSLTFRHGHYPWRHSSRSLFWNFILYAIMTSTRRIKKSSKYYSSMDTKFMPIETIPW